MESKAKQLNKSVICCDMVAIYSIFDYTTLYSFSKTIISEQYTATAHRDSIRILPLYYLVIIYI